MRITMSLILVFLLSVFSPIITSTREVTNDLSSVQIQYGNVGNEGTTYKAKVTVINSGFQDIDTRDESVTIYVCFIRQVKDSNKPGGIVVAQNPDVTVYHIDGCSHTIVFDAPFRLSAGMSKVIHFDQLYWMVSYTDVVPNWYIKLGTHDYKLIQNTDAEQRSFVDPFINETQYLRNKDDKILPWTPGQRYSNFKRTEIFDKDTVQERLIPTASQKLNLNSAKEYIGPYNSINDIQFRFTEDINLVRDEHVIVISNYGVEIRAKSQNSFLLAKSTVQQLLERLEGKLPVGRLPNNKPRFEYRTFMLDISRHFHKVEDIKILIDTLWRYKLNVLHLHLTDDESWAIEIDKLPELTEIGSKQCFDMNRCANYPQYGSKLDDGRKYLTKQEYIEIIQYAMGRGITVLPEIDVPGHSTAAINAMKIRHQKRPYATDYRLHDHFDNTKYRSAQFFTRGVMNPCIGSTYSFFELIMKTLIRYHEEAGQTLTKIHLGGDEVPKSWVNSTACNNVLQTYNESYIYLKKMMLRQFGAIASRNKVSLGFWEDGLIGENNIPLEKDEIFPKDVDVYVNTWQTVWEWGGGNRPYNLANAGFKVIFNPATYFYMDHPHEPNPMERGYYWARRFVDLLTTYRFRPDNFYANIDGPGTFGAALSKKEFCSTEDKCPALRRPENIVGGMAALFTETVYNFDHIGNNVFPRVIAVAERLWHEATWESLPGENPTGLTQDFDLFRQVIETYELPYLASKSIKYHLSPPGVNITEPESLGGSYKLLVNTEFAGQKVFLIKPGTMTPIGMKVGIEYSFPPGTYGLRLYTCVEENGFTRQSYEITLDLPTLPAASVESN